MNLLNELDDERWMDGWMDEQMDGRTDGWMDRWMDGRTDGWMDGWTDGWTDGRMDVWMNEFLTQRGFLNDSRSIRCGDLAQDVLTFAVCRSKL